MGRYMRTWMGFSNAMAEWWLYFVRYHVLETTRDAVNFMVYYLITWSRIYERRTGASGPVLVSSQTA